MSTQLNGDAGLVSRPSAKAIASTTATTPIVVTTSLAHNLTTGDTVIVKNVANNLPANGVQVVTVIDALNVSLNGTVGSGSAGAESSATIQSIGFDATFAIPADVTDALNASSVNVAFEALADRTAWLSARVASKYVVCEDSAYLDDVNLGTGPSTWSSNASGTSGWREIANTPEVFLYGSQAGDYVEVDFQSTVTCSSNNLAAIAPLWVNNGTVLGKLAGAGRVLQDATIEYTETNDGSLHAFVPVPATLSRIDSIVIGWYRYNTAPTLAFIGDYSLRVRLWRST